MKLIHKLFRLSIVVLMILFVSPASNALAFSAGPYNPASGTNLSGTGTEPWLTPENIAVAGSASVNLYQGHQFSVYLQGTQYGFDIPSDATIDGIEVMISRMMNGPGPGIYDNVVSLVISDTVVGDNKASELVWPYSFATVTYGSPTDLWGTIWTPSEVNAPGFGAVLSAKRGNNGVTDKFAYVDTIQITVYYSYSTTTDAACESPVVYGDTISCVVTVTRTGGELTPTGTVDWESDGNGTFDPVACDLTGTGVIATCSTFYTPTSVGSGSHLITATYSGDDYFTTSSADDTVIVDPRPVTVTADAIIKVYTEPDPELTYQVTGGLAFSDTFTGTLAREPGEDVGTYAILQNTLALNQNYELTYVGADFTIEPIAITVTADPLTKVFGQLDPTLTYTITSGTLLPGDTITGTITREPGEDAGTYAILQGSLALPGYYSIIFEGADFTITKADATCTITPYDLEFDGLPHTATGSCTGVNSETLAGLDLASTSHYKPGDYVDPWTFTDVTGNYNNASGTVNDHISGNLYYWPIFFK